LAYSELAGKPPTVQTYILTGQPSKSKGFFHFF